MCPTGSTCGACEGVPLDSFPSVLVEGPATALVLCSCWSVLAQVPAAEVYCPKYDEEMVLQPEAEGSAATAAEDTKKGV